MFDDFLKAAIPDPVTCLGVRLRPLSLGSLFLLYRFRNAYLLKESQKSPPLGDLLQGIIVCSQKFDEAQATLSDPDLARDMKDWRRKLEKPGWFSRASKADIAFRINRASNLFAGFIAAGIKYPCTQADCGPEKEIGSAWPILTLTALMDELHQDFDIAINQPLALSRWLIASNAERQGRLEIVEREEMKSLQAEADAIAKEVFGGQK